MYIKITTNDRNSLLELHKRLAELGINYFVVRNQVMPQPDIQVMPQPDFQLK